MPAIWALERLREDQEFKTSLGDIVNSSQPELHSKTLCQKKFFKCSYQYMMVTQGVLLWHFHTYVWCSLVLFITPIILPLLPLPFYKWLRQVTVFHIHTLTERTSTIFTFLYPPHLPSSSHYYPALNMTCFTFLSFIVLVLVHCSVWLCLGILPAFILYFYQSDSLCYSSLPRKKKKLNRK
jgi:hypothetical protein